MVCTDSGAGTTTTIVGAHVTVQSSSYISQLTQNRVFCGDSSSFNVGFLGYNEIYLKVSGTKIVDVTSSGVTVGGSAVATVGMTPASGTPVLNYGGLQLWTSDFSGSGGTFGTYSNKVAVYNNAGSFIVFLPII